MNTVARTLALTSLLFFALSDVSMAEKSKAKPPAPKPAAPPKKPPVKKPPPKKPPPAKPPVKVVSLLRGYPGTFPTSEEARAIFNYTNNERALDGLPALAWDVQLAAAAQKYADYLASTQQLDHYASGTPVTRAAEAGFKLFRLMGENLYEGLAAGYFRGPDGAMRAWMWSQAHRDNILNDVFNLIGVGVAEDVNHNLYYVQMFGRRL